MIEDGGGASIMPVTYKLKIHFDGNPIRVIEIGARFGESTMLLLRHLNIEQYYIVDPYTAYEGYISDGFNDIINNDVGDDIMTKTKNLVNKTRRIYNPLGNPVKFIRKFSDDAHQQFENGSIDLIFVDGNHEYKYVLNDIKNYFPKVKQGGIICGDDYFMRSHENDVLNTMLGNDGYDRPMVFEAVQEFSKKYNLKVSGFGKHRNYPKTWLIEK